MNIIYLNSDVDSLNQSSECIVTIGKEQRVVRFDIRYLEATHKWYASMYDRETGKPYFTYVPMVASYEDFNDLIRVFNYKGTGFMVCVPIMNEPSSVSPEKDNFSEFGVVWGDSVAE